MTTEDEIYRRIERETILKVARSIRAYAEKHYPRDLFPLSGQTPDAAVARFARILCDALAKELERTANSGEDEG